jgi:hypothetical protein
MVRDRDRWRAVVNAVIEVPGSIKRGEILDQLQAGKLLKNNSAPCSKY